VIPRSRSLAALAVLIAGTASVARAGDICAGPTAKELGREVHEHLRKAMEIDQKWRYVYLGRGPLPPPKEVKPEDVTAYLAALTSRRAAVLYQVREGDALCTWLVSAKGLERSLTTVDPARYASLGSRLLAALDVSGKARARAPAPRGVELAEPPVRAEKRESVLAEASAVLFPPPIAEKLVNEGIDTLVVVPIEDLGAVPFSAVPVGGKPLVERASVLVVPTFAAFLGKPRPHRSPLSPAVVVGDPAYGYDQEFVLPALPGAREEAEEVGKLVGATPLLGPAATKSAVTAKIRRAKGGVGLVYLATHGRADPVNPADGSVLWTAGQRWSAREMSRLPLAASRPLVVLSACQTALGKSFQGGTIGLARAWAHAGASSVVMSLWRVDDSATRALMTCFMRSAAKAPPDVALRRAMLALREEDPDPAHWASFAVYGVPAPMPAGGAPEPPPQGCRSGGAREQGRTP
jgi:hypothetical protein